MNNLPKINMSEGWQELSNCPEEGILEFLQIDKNGNKYVEVADIKKDIVYYSENTKWRPLTESVKKALLDAKNIINSPVKGRV